MIKVLILPLRACNIRLITSTDDTDTPSYVPSLQPSSSPVLEYSATPSIVLSNKPIASESDVPTGNPSVFPSKFSYFMPLYFFQ